MDLVNKTLYNKDLIIKYNRYYLVSFLKTNFLIVASITIGFMVYMLIAGMWEYALVFLGILVFYLALTFLLQSLTTRRVLKQSPLVKNPVIQTYTFTSAGISITNSKLTSLPYSEISKIRSTKEFFIISDFSKRTFIVQKSGFADPQKAIGELDRFFKDTFGKKYR